MGENKEKKVGFLYPGADIWIQSATMEGTEVSTSTTHYRYLESCLSFHENEHGNFASFTAWLVMDDFGMVVPINPLTDTIFLEDPTRLEDDDTLPFLKPSFV